MIIEQIINDVCALSLIKNDKTYLVVLKVQNSRTSYIYDTLLEALNKFNGLAEKLPL